MDLLAMIRELREEWHRIDDAITALERLEQGTRRGRDKGSKPATASASVGRSIAAEAPNSGGLKKSIKPAQPVSHFSSSKDQS